jgi:hypothetical protein
LQQLGAEVGGGAGLVVQVLGGYQLHGIGEALGEALAVAGGFGAGLGALLVAGAGGHEGSLKGGVGGGGEVGAEGGGVGAGGGGNAAQQQLGREQGGLGVLAAAVGEEGGVEGGVLFALVLDEVLVLFELELRPGTSLAAADEFTAYAETGATAPFDSQYDAVKVPNTTGFNLAGVAASGEPLAIDGRAAFTAATVLPLTVGVPAAGTYALSAAALNNLPTGLDAYLADDLTGQVVRLSQGTSYSFSVSAAQAAATLTGRFRLLFRPATALATAAPSLSAADVTVFPNPAHARFTVLLPGLSQASTVQAELLNALGQVVRRLSAALPATGTQLTLETAELATGVYTLRLLAGPTTLAKRVVIE